MMSSHTFLMEHMNFGVHPSKTREDTVKIDVSGSQTGGSGQCVRGEGRTLDTDQTDSLWRWTTDGQGSSERLHNDEKRISTKYHNKLGDKGRRGDDGGKDVKDV